MHQPKTNIPSPFAIKDELIALVPTERKEQVSYIEGYYSKSIVSQPKDEKTKFGLPHPYLVPDYKFFTEFFYWDTFFMLLGLFFFKDSKDFIAGILQNFSYEIERFGKIPNNNTYYSLSRSQSPYFAQAIRAYLDHFPEDIHAAWIETCIKNAIIEYQEVWLGQDKRNSNRLTSSGLSRYWDVHNDLDIFAEYESGWDTTSRFGGYCMSINPVDLNTQLYQYEDCFEWYFQKTGNLSESALWTQKKQARKKLIDTLCWNEDMGIYMDYNFVDNKTTGFISAASFFPFYAGIADKIKASRSIPLLLATLEQEGGIAATQAVAKEASYKNQWDSPEGWAPHQYVMYVALRNYGFEAEAERIKNKWLGLCDSWFKKDGYLYEKYNVVQPGTPVASKTPARPGFGWTNGVYFYLLFSESALSG